MLGSKILEVVIGIIFIFLLYSLLVTAIQEILSSIFFLRARMLRIAIRRMLIDDKTQKCKNANSSFWHSILVRTENMLSFFFPFLRRFWKPESNLATLFYEQPGIKYLGLSNWYKRPSFIKPENFAKTLCDILINSSKTNNNESQKISETLNANVITYKEKVISIDPETLEYINSLWRDAQQDADKFKTLLSNWFLETMDRLSIAYKHRTQLNVFIIGFIIAFAFNVDTVSITNKLSKDDKARSELAQLASSYMSNQDKNSVKSNQNDTMNNASSDTITVEIQKVFTMLREDVNASNNLIALGWDIPENFNKSIRFDSIIKANANIKGKKRKTKLNICQQCTQTLYNNRPKPVREDTELTISEKLKYVNCVASKNKSFIGILITAIAISLGAPFWFDLLSKIMKLRSTNTTEKKDTQQ